MLVAVVELVLLPVAVVRGSSIGPGGVSLLDHVLSAGRAPVEVGVGPSELDLIRGARKTAKLNLQHQQYIECIKPFFTLYRVYKTLRFERL